MKQKLIFIVIALLTLASGKAQTYISMRPNWTFNTPAAKSTSIRYYVARGTGSSEKDARNDAFAQIIKESQIQVGMAFSSSNVVRAFQNGEDINSIANDYNIPIREICKFSEHNQKESSYIYWYLVQMPTSGSTGFPYESFEGDCYDFSKAQQLRNLMKDEYKPSIKQQEKKDRQEQRNIKKDKRSNSLSYDRGNYVAWGIAGAGYPWDLFTSIDFRYGNAIGVGAYANIGADFTHIVVNKEYYCTKTMFGYAAGIKFFPFRGMFLSCGYGSIPSASKSVTIKGYESNHKGQIEDIAVINTARDYVKQNSGMLVHAGYDLVTDLSNHAGFFLGINAGVSLDFANKVAAPSAQLKIGIAWKY